MRGLKQHLPDVCAINQLDVARSAPLMRGLKPSAAANVASIPGPQVARSAPLMRGLKLGRGLKYCRLATWVARSAPLMRGLKRQLLRSPDGRRSESVARSAPLMRGLKLSEARRNGLGFDDLSRAVCPANEGIETQIAARRQLAERLDVARSAPLMRGLKLKLIWTLYIGHIFFTSRGLPR